MVRFASQCLLWAGGGENPMQRAARLSIDVGMVVPRGELSRRDDASTLP